MFRRGFKSEAERISLAIREELGLGVLDPLDCQHLCQHLGIPVLSLHQLRSLGAATQSVIRLQQAGAGFSALTVCAGTKRLIVYNPAHPPGRRANSLAHELSHIILEHPLAPALGPGGCRRWDSNLEDEANWQGATLLVPREGALVWMSRHGSPEEGARHFGVSVALFTWRINQTGVMRQISAARMHGW